MSVNDVFEARRAANYVDPMLGYVDARRRLNEQIPTAVAALRQHGLPSHGLAHQAKFDGREIIVWRYVYADPAATGQKVKRGEPSPPRRALGFCIDESSAPFQAKFLHTKDVDADEPLYEEVDLDKLSTVVISGMVGLLERIAKPTKRKPWDT